jgi:hypothetical protein
MMCCVVAAAKRCPYRARLSIQTYPQVYPHRVGSAPSRHHGQQSLDDRYLCTSDT